MDRIYVQWHALDSDISAVQGRCDDSALRPAVLGRAWGERPPSYLIISLLGGFLLFLAFGVNPWLSAVGAIAVTFCSYNMQIIQVGHNTKMVAIAFMPWVLAALVYAYRRKAFLGAVLFALALSFQIKANHPQITYYLAFIVFGYAIAELCGAIVAQKRQKAARAGRLSDSLLTSGTTVVPPFRETPLGRWLTASTRPVTDSNSTTPPPGPTA